MLSCLLDGAYKKYLAVNRKEKPIYIYIKCVECIKHDYITQMLM